MSGARRAVSIQVFLIVENNSGRWPAPARPAVLDAASSPYLR
jgi:hypothetical protein